MSLSWIADAAGSIVGMVFPAGIPPWPFRPRCVAADYQTGETQRHQCHIAWLRNLDAIGRLSGCSNEQKR